MGEDKVIEKSVLLAWALENIVYRYSEAQKVAAITKNYSEIKLSGEISQETIEAYKKILRDFLFEYKDQLDEDTTFQIL